jgi:CRP/FNR family transcriptional regulator
MKDMSRALLRELDLFRGFDDGELTSLARYFKLRRFTRGEVLWRQGAPAQVYTFIHAGHVKVVMRRSDGREFIVDVLGRGDPIGMTAVYRRVPYVTGSVALSDVKLLTIHRDHFYGAIRRTAVRELLVEHLMTQNNQLLGRLHELSEPSAEQRLAMLFVKFAERHGQATGEDDDRRFIGLPLSRRDLCDLINTTVETAIRLMSKWRKQGVMETDKQGFVVLDMARLLEIAAGT